MSVRFFTMKTPKGEKAERARGFLIVKILNKCTLSILVYILFLERQCSFYLLLGILLIRNPKQAVFMK